MPRPVAAEVKPFRVSSPCREETERALSRSDSAEQYVRRLDTTGTLDRSTYQLRVIMNESLFSI